MKVDELEHHKYNYPRGRDKDSDNDIKPLTENVERIEDYIKQFKKPPQKIKYNKHKCKCHNKYPIIDGTHTWIALKQLGYTDIKEDFLLELDLPIEKELIYAIHYNVSHGLQVSRSDMKASLKTYLDQHGKMQQGDLKEISKLWNIPYNTLAQWVEDVKHGKREVLCTAQNSSGSEGQEDKELEKLRQEIKETQEELAKVKIDARQAFWEMICETHQEAIKGCKKCGK